MSKPKKIPAPKTTKPAPKKAPAPKTPTPKDVAAPTTPSPAKAAAPKPRDSRLPAPGTVLAREYKGKTCKIAVGESTFAYEGKTYTSLSALAREITGAASINGYLWLGLTGAKQPAPKATSATKPGKGAKPTEPKIGGSSNDVATPAGQRAALAAAGLVKKAKDAKGA